MNTQIKMTSQMMDATAVLYGRYDISVRVANALEVFHAQARTQKQINEVKIPFFWYLADIKQEHAAPSSG
jgi:hypothetical protein